MDVRHLYENIVATTKALIVVLDVDGRIVLFNPACEELTGYRFEEVKGRTVWDFLLTPEERDPVKAVFNDLRAGRFPKTYQNYWVTRSGALHFIEWSNTAVTDEHGRVTHVIGTGIDVTGRRAAESASREGEARFRNLADNVPLVFWIRELPANRIIYVSPAYETIWGRKLADLDEAFRSFLESIHPDDREMLFRQMERETEAHEAAETEYRVLRPDGSVHWIHSRAVPVRDQAGKVYRIVGFAEDITDRKHTEQALREVQQRQRAIFDAIPDPIWMKDEEGRYLFANRTFMAHRGLDASEIIGRTSFDLHSPEVSDQYTHEDHYVLTIHQPFRGERTRLVGGKRRTFDTTKVPVLDDAGNAIGTAGIARDITERREAERVLHETPVREKALLDNIPDIAWLKDGEGRYIAVNRVFGHVFNIDAEQIAGKTDFDIFPQATAAQFAAEDRAVMASGTPWRHEELLSRAVGQKWMETVKVPIKNDAGEIIGIAGTSRDITERKLAEAQRIACNVAQRAALVKEVHHRIKNNLQGVVTLVERWATQHPEHTDLWDTVITRINAIASVHGLHGSTGERDLRLDQIILRLVSSLKNLYRDLPLQLSIHSDSANVRVTESEIVPLALIVNELIMNAIKHSHSPRNGSPVDVVLEGAGACVRIVFHNAIGKLAPQFDFDASDGLGTGLSLVKSLLPVDGALLRFENTTGPAGVTVELTLRPPVITSVASST